MTSGWLFLCIGAVMAAFDLAMVRFTVRAMRRQGGVQPMDGRAQMSPAAIARTFRVGALIIFLFFAAIAFGLIPLAHVQPIQLH